MKRILALLLMICCCSERGTEATVSFKFETATVCPNNKKLPATFLSFQVFNLKGKLCAIAEIDVKETLTGPISLEIGLKRCNEDLSQCTTYPPIKFENICNQFNTTYYGPEFFSRIKPPLKCPFKPGRYLFNRTIADFSNLGKVSIMTGKYKSKHVAFDKKNGKRRPILCWGMITRVAGVTSRKN